MFASLQGNSIVNSYWEKNLPSNFAKPNGNSTRDEVKVFMTQKYVDLKWIDSKMKHDPVYLAENKPDKLKKFLKKRMGQADADSDQDTPPTSAPTKQPPQQMSMQAQKQKPAAAAPVMKAPLAEFLKPVGDLFSCGIMPGAQPQQANQLPDQLFGDFQQPAAAVQQPGFPSTFQQAPAPQINDQQNAQMQNLLNMLQTPQQPQQTQQQQPGGFGGADHFGAQSGQVPKSTGFQPQAFESYQQQQQMNQQMMNQQQQQQQMQMQMPTPQFYTGPPKAQAADFGSFQSAMFNQQPSVPQNNNNAQAFGGFQSSVPIQQPAFGQPSFGQPAFGHNLSQPPYGQAQQQQSSQLYGGLVDLSLNSNAQAKSIGFGQPPAQNTNNASFNVNW